jgi:hypothetical protein
MSTAAQIPSEGELRQRQRQPDLDNDLSPPSAGAQDTGSSTPDLRPGNGVENKEKKTYGRTPDGTGICSRDTPNPYNSWLIQIFSASLHCTYNT